MGVSLYHHHHPHPLIAIASDNSLTLSSVSRPQMECITAQDQSDIDAGGETEDKDERSDEEAQTPRCQSD